MRIAAVMNPNEHMPGSSKFNNHLEIFLHGFHANHY